MYIVIVGNVIKHIGVASVLVVGVVCSKAFKFFNSVASVFAVTREMGVNVFVVGVFHVVSVWVIPAALKRLGRVNKLMFESGESEDGARTEVTAVTVVVDETAVVTVEVPTVAAVVVSGRTDRLP